MPDAGDNNIKFPAGGGLDELGIATHTLVLRTDKFDEVYTIGEGEFEGLHEKQGGRTWEHVPVDEWDVSVTYEGLVKDTGLETFQILPVRTDEALESHPYIDVLKEKFGGFEDADKKIKFPLFLPDSLGTRLDPTLGLVGPGRNGQAREKNPMFGWESYIKKGRIVEHRFTTQEYPQEIDDADGTIVQEVPASYINTPEGKDWLLHLENINELVKVGGFNSGDIVFEVVVRYFLSQAGGWPPMHLLIEDLNGF